MCIFVVYFNVEEDIHFCCLLVFADYTLLNRTLLLLNFSIRIVVGSAFNVQICFAFFLLFDECVPMFCFITLENK